MFNNNTIQRFNDTETPFYYYDMDVLRKRLMPAAMHRQNMVSMCIMP
jgi:hypothetical protein